MCNKLHKLLVIKTCLEKGSLSLIPALCELDQDDPIGEGGSQEGGHKASVHREKPASGDLRVAPQLQKQDL